MEPIPFSIETTFSEFARTVAEAKLYPYGDKIDIELQEAIQTGNRERYIVLLEEIANTLEEVEFFDSSSNLVTALIRRYGRSIDIEKIPLTKLADISRNRIAFRDFFTRELDIKEILAYLSGCIGKDESFSDLYARLISALLAKDIETVELTVSDLNNASILFNNITTFRNWFFDRVIDDDLGPFLRVLPAFIRKDADQLAAALGRSYTVEREALIQVLDGIENVSRYQGYRDTVIGFSELARRTAFLEDPQYIPLEGELTKTVAERGRDFIPILFLYTDWCFNVQFSDLHTFFTGNKRVTVEAGESIYLRRFGIENVTFDTVDYDIHKEGIRVRLELEDGFCFEFIAYNPNERPDGWVEVFVDRLGLSYTRIYELMIFIQGLLMDVLRYRDHLQRGTYKEEVQTARRLLKVSDKIAHVRINCLDISRRLLMAAGIEGRFLHDVDVIDPVTAEVYRRRSVLQYALSIKDANVIKKLRIMNSALFTDLAKAFIVTSDISSIAACEYVLLQRL